MSELFVPGSAAGEEAAARLLRTAAGLRAEIIQLRRQNVELSRLLGNGKNDAWNRREAQRAAMNILEDTISARQQTEAVNEELQCEIRLRRQAEARLSESEGRFRRMAEVSEHLVWVAAADGALEYLNQHWVSYTGLTLTGTAHLEQMIGAIHPEDRGALVDRLRQSIAAGEKFEIELRLRRADRSYRWFLLRAVPLIDALNQPAKWYGTFTDIDQLKQLQTALRQADRRKTEFLAMLGHELRTPLTAVKGGIELLQSDRVDEATQAAMLPIIAGQVVHMERLIHEVFDLARVSQGKIELRSSPVHLQDIVQSAVAMVRELLREKRCELRVEMPAEPVRLIADPVRLTQVFVNLLSNSAKYSDAGRPIELLIEPQSREATVRVKDQGHGISADLLPHVFEMFVQGTHPFHSPEGGLGLGLSLVRKLVELHGGFVEAHSDGEGKGSEFVVSLPIVHRHGTRLAEHAGS